MKNIKLLFLVFCIVCGSCKQETKTNENLVATKTKKQLNQYTVIFKKRDTSDTHNPRLYGCADISNFYYIGNYFHLKQFIPSDYKKTDTINFQFNKAKIPVYLSYYQVQTFDYLLSSGDTLIVQYKEGMPEVKLMNRKYPKYEFSYDSLRRKSFQIKGIEDEELFSIEKNPVNFKKFLLKKKKKYEKERLFIDSLYTNNLISLDYKNLLKERTVYNYLKLSSSYYLTKYYPEVTVPYSKEDLNKEHLTNCRFYFSFLYNYTYNILNKQRGTYSKNGFTRDSKSAFDLVLKDSLIESNKIKKHLLTFLLEQIYTYNSREDFAKYYDIYKGVVNDSLLVSNFEKKFILDFATYSEEKKKVLFVNRNRKMLTMEDILKKNKGKLIYVDYWASWCAPCRAMMPESKILKEEYKGKDIVFLYISIDKDFEKWKDASKEENISSNNFLAINPKADFYKELNVGRIPRYMLYNKKGEIIHKNAPKPDTKEIRELFDKLLSK